MTARASSTRTGLACSLARRPDGRREKAPRTRLSTSYGLAFHHDPTGKISQAQRELMTAQPLFKQAGLHDAEDAYFWIDPFSPDGQPRSCVPSSASCASTPSRHRPVAEAPPLRSSSRTLENPDALDALELGARRIDSWPTNSQAAQD